MDANGDAYLDLIKRIESIFYEVDSDIIVDLHKSNEEYIAVRNSMAGMKAQYPFIADVLEGGGAISLTAGERKVLSEYFSLYRRADNMERRQLYFRGHTDCFAYLKRVGAI